jgi:hypothetical protein
MCSGTVGHSLFGHRRGVGVGADAQAAVLVGPLHHGLEQLVGVALLGLQSPFQHALHFGVGALDQALVDGSGCAVDGDVIAFLQHMAASGQSTLLVIDGDFAGAADTDFAELTCHECCV